MEDVLKENVGGAISVAGLVLAVDVDNLLSFLSLSLSEESISVIVAGGIDWPKPENGEGVVFDDEPKLNPVEGLLGLASLTSLELVVLKPPKGDAGVDPKDLAGVVLVEDAGWPNENPENTGVVCLFCSVEVLKEKRGVEV